uniref:carboxypeptidase-like regulatory domain-containing protein n=1 Tax=Flavobacterium sp. TaxID=239 RepID=UPI0040498BF5
MKFLKTTTTKSKSLYSSLALIKYLLLLFCISGNCQEFFYNGTVLESGQPIPGASICVKNYNRCTISNFDGNYSIRVKVGDVLVINYIGLETTEIKIKSSMVSSSEFSNGVPVEKHIVLPIKTNDYAEKFQNNDDTLSATKNIGTANLNLNSFPYIMTAVNIVKDQNNFHTFKFKSDYHKLQIDFNSEFLMGVPIRLQDFQNQFSQGRSLNGVSTYQSPETNEIFSWGPNISTLAISEVPTVFYPNGNIINRTSQDENPVFARNTNQFFRNTVDTKNALSLILEMKNHDIIKLNLSRTAGQGSLQNNQNNQTNANLSFQKSIEHHKIKSNINYNLFHNDLTNSNFAYNKIIFANAINPIHFDQKIISSLPSGFPRNFSQLENNPYYLLRFNQDKNKSETVGFTISDDYDHNDVDNKITAVYQFSDVDNTFGNLPFSAEIDQPNYTKRNERFQSFSITNDFKYSFDYNTSAGAVLNFNHQNRSLNRFTQSGFENPIDYPNNFSDENILNKNQERVSVNLKLCGKLNLQEIFYSGEYFALNFYPEFSYSSTLKNNMVVNLKSEFEWERLFYSDFSLYVDWSLNNYEPDLQNNNSNFNSLRYGLDQFKQIQNTFELFSPNSTTPIKESLFSVTGVVLYPIDIAFEVYQKRVSNLYAPIFEDNNYVWKPAIDYDQVGLDFKISKFFNKSYDSELTYRVDVNFSTYRNKVTRINQELSRIPIAGFSDINKNYMINEPLGVIVGSAYERDENNNMIIDDQGFPIVSNEPRILGDPNPDFVIGQNNEIQYRKFKLNLGFDWSQGGELWNGTQQTLNYYGASKLTESQRHIAGFVFQGVNQNGLPNTQAVDFYNPNLPIEENRWVRYGVGGVAEDAIEDATFFRLNFLKLSYSHNISYGKDLFKITYGLSVKNVFVVTKNLKAFGSNSMFNSVETSNLDYFNAPLLRTFGGSININF